LEKWNVGRMEKWSDEVMENWKGENVGRWVIGMMEQSIKTS